MDLYLEEIMDYFENPRNQGEIIDPTFEARDSNASCGDMVQFQIKVDEGKIMEVKWKGIGCAISTAAASKLSEFLLEKKLVELKLLSEEEMLKRGIGFEVNPGRMKCLMLPVRVVKRVLQNSS